MVRAASIAIVGAIAALGLVAPAQGAPALRSAFVPIMVPGVPTAMKGSLQNKPSGNGTPGGPAVGTGKQRKQAEIVDAKARAEAKILKIAADAAKKAFRESA
mmetsp:Transcript_20392/g.49341  ORF Transcript_20392/g.49341 Transcript_20392/m.49341 type:complete len:102 (-) Transcript_20392:382-687(-)